MVVTSGSLDGLVTIAADVHRDERGFVCERWSDAGFRAAGIAPGFVQDTVSGSRARVLRGLHYQVARPQGKLVWVAWGEVFDVALDLRPSSPTFGRWESQVLSRANALAAYLPPGFAHGFQVLSDWAVVAYKCTERYDADTQGSVLWSDPDLDIAWPAREPVLSARDAAAPRLCDIPRERLPIAGT